MRVELDAADFQEYGADNLTAMALPSGATASQPFTFYITLSEAVLPPGYTAITP